jgi:hypothetical protein
LAPQIKFSVIPMKNRLRITSPDDTARGIYA